MQSRFVVGDSVRSKSDGQWGVVVKMKFASKSPYHVKELQIRWDAGQTNWVKVSKIVKAGYNL